MKLITFLISIFVMIFAWATEPRVTISEKPLVANEGAIHLRDIATFENIPREWMESLGQKEISTNKDQFYGMSARNFMSKIRVAISSFESQCHCHVELNIPRTLLLYSFNGKFNSEKAKKKILNIMDNSCSNCEFHVKDWKLMRGTIPESYKTWTVDSGVEALRGPSYVNVYFDNDILNPLVFSLNVDVYREVMRAKKSVLMGADLNRSLFYKEKVNVTQEKRVPASLPDMEGAQLRRSFPARQIVYVDDLVEKTLAHTGQAVRIEFIDDQVTLEMPGLARKNGKLGELIPVTINKTRKKLMAKVVAEGRVRVQR